ncbi:MAG: lysostaphin resistance A-like protein [Xanthobacteraceae bacterium]
MRIWGYWATFGWALLAFLVGQFVALAVLVWWRVGELNTLIDVPFDGIAVALFILVANPITIAILVLAVRLARASQAEYLALTVPQARDLRVGIVCIVALIAISDALLYVTGQPLVTPFQLQSYSTAAAEGWLAPFLIAAVIVAPASEEIIFRGFLFRGWARSDRAAWPAIVVISVLWAALHVQYDWTGILQIFVIGLFLGWMRWRSGSLLLTILLHALFNLEGMAETIVQIRFFS